VTLSHAQEIDSTENKLLKGVKVSSITGGRSEVFKLPGSAHFISPLELSVYKHSNVERILRNIPGINMQEEDGFGLRPNIGMRGSGAERSAKVAIMEDGILMAPAPYAASSAYFFPTMGRMHAVEIVKGSSQIRFGPNTSGGAINLISTPIPEDFKARVSLKTGTFGMRSVHAFAGKSFSHGGVLVETFQSQADGFKELPDQGETGFKIQDYLIKARLNTSSDQKIQTSLNFKLAENTEVSNETYLGITSKDFESNSRTRYAASQFDQMDAKQRQMSVNHQLRISPSLELSTTLYRTDFARNWYKLNKVLDSSGAAKSIASLFGEFEQQGEYYELFHLRGKGALEIKANNRVYYAQGISSNLTWVHEGEKANHELQVGIRLHKDVMDRFQWQDVYAVDNGLLSLEEAGVAGTESNRLQTAKALASYIHYKFEFKKWTLIPGLRMENINFEKLDYGKSDVDRDGLSLKSSSNQASVLLPGIGISYAIKADNIFIAGVHRGFSPQSFGEEARPEESTNYEAGIRSKQKLWTATCIGFYTDYENLLGVDNASSGGTGSGISYNGGQARVYGLEFQASLFLDRFFKLEDVGLPFSMSYTYSKANFLTAFDSDFEAWSSVSLNDELPYLPQHQLSAQLSCFVGAFSFNYNWRYQSEMRALPGQGEISIQELIPSYHTSELALSYTLKQKVELSANVLNLFNTEYIASRRPAGLRPGLPRMLQFGIEFNL